MRYSVVLKLIMTTMIILLSFLHSNAKIVYVASSLGDDQFDGTINFPFKTIKHALTVADTLYLLAEDIFYETIYTEKKYISRYGVGNNPVISGYKRLIKPQWKHICDDIWSLDLTGEYFIGNNILGAAYINNIGCFHDFNNDSIHGRRVRFLDDLENDWDFWQTERYDNLMPTSEFSLLYMCYSGDPNTLNIEFSTGQTAMRISECVIDGIDVEGFGFGISAGTNVRIRNCHIDAIGGMLFRGYNRFEMYGNGIEFFVSKDIRNCIVENCVVSRTFDSGITIQVSSAYDYSPTNILIANNLLMSCGQAWEDYIMNDDHNVVFKECIFKNNIIVNSGNSGFGYRDNKVLCNVLGYNNRGYKGMIIESNIFIGGNFYSSPPYKGYYKSNQWKNNICYFSEGDYIFSSNGQEYLYVKSGRKEFSCLCKEYRRLVGDSTTCFVVMRKRRIRQLQKKYIRKFLNSNPTFKLQESIYI